MTIDFIFFFKLFLYFLAFLGMLVVYATIKNMIKRRKELWERLLIKIGQISINPLISSSPAAP